MYTALGRMFFLQETLIGLREHPISQSEPCRRYLSRDERSSRVVDASTQSTTDRRDDFFSGVSTLYTLYSQPTVIADLTNLSLSPTVPSLLSLT